MAAEANNVTLSTNFNVAPYYDDFNESKNFHRILFRPGLAVQARELTQMQTILQNQIDRFAEHIFKEGSTVRGMEANYDTRYSYIKLRNNTSTGADVTVTNFDSKIVKGVTSGVLAKVIKVNDGSEANTPNFKTLFVKYLAANNTTGFKFFANNEIVNTVGGGTIYSANTITSAQGGATGYGSAVTFNAGVVYAKDHFIRVPEQTVVVSKYDTTTASGRIGFDVTETIVTETADETLLDPAQGAYNYAAPGAARLKLTADLRRVGLNDTVSNTFVELFQVKDGVVQSISTRPQYARIRDYIAQRTFDESGDYVVNGFEINVKEHLKVGNNQGVLTAGNGGNSQLLVVYAEPGKAYVKGYDIERVASTNRVVQKAIDTESIESAKALADYGNYLIVDNVVGNWDLNRQSIVSLRSQQANAVSTLNYSSTNFPASQIGTARVRGVEYYTGTPGLPSAQYKLYITDVKMAAGQSFTGVQSIGFNGGVGTVKGKADVLGSNGLNANTVDPLFDRAVFRLPAQAIKRLRNTSGAVNNDYSFYKSFDITFNSAGQAQITTGDTSETFDGSGTLSDAATRTDFYVVSRSNGNTTTFSETLTTTSGSNTVTASATIDGKVNPGDIINIHTGGGNFLVSAVNGTTINLFGNASASGAGKAFHKRFFAGQVLDLAGNGRDGARSIAVSGTPTTTADLDINETLNSTSLDATAIVKLNKIDGQEQAKTVQRNRLVQIRVGAGGGTSYTANTTGPWPLGLSDGFKLVEVRKKNGSNFASTTEGTDVTSHFTIDSGMFDSFYSHASLKKKSSSSLSIVSGDRLLVKLDYFTHGTSNRGFFSVDSYPVDDATAASDSTKIFTYEIPVFVSPTNGISYDLRDCVDFRPRMTDTANNVTSVTNISINPKTSNTFVLPSGGLHFSPPNEDFTTDLDYYLRRIDIVGLNTDGELIITRGVPALRPATPPAPNDVMAMASIDLAPYPSLPPVIARRVGRPDMANKFRKFNNRRYTMRDIGKIAERIDRLEYYTSLTLLEKSAQDMLVQDANGLDRFKNGILVDSFTTHAVGNVFDPDYKIAIDPERGEIRPRFSIDETPLVMTANSTHVVRTNVTPSGVSKDQVITLTTAPTSATFLAGATVTSGSYTATIRHKVGTKLYVENATGNFAAAATITSSDSGSRTISSVTASIPGKLVTLPYTHEVLIRQPYATTTRNCVGTFYKYVGLLQLDPDNDYWCDTVQGPDTNISIDLNTDAWEYLASTWPATWNSPITSFTGGPVLTGSSTNDVGGTYSVPQADGSTIIYQNTQTVSTFATPTVTTQTGNQTGVGFVTTTQSYGNIVKDTSIIPFMRSRQILFKMSGMLPSVRVYGFFDGVNVNAYITPITEAEYNSKLKSATGAPVNPAASAGSALVVGTDGVAYGVFRIPNDASLKFRTGSKRLRFVDSPTNSITFGQFTTSCEAAYTAEGLLQNVSALTITTKSVEITQTSLNSTTYGSQTSSTTASGTRIVGVIPPDPGDDGTVDPPRDDGDDSDPIAQSMFISSRLVAKTGSSGMYMTKIDLFFATKDPTLPITVQLQEIEPLTGHITPRVVPFSRVVVPSADVNISTDGSAPTPVVFPSPVYLSNETEYAVVLIPAAVNPNYNAFTAVLGEKDLVAGSVVSEQPASGFMFTSANQRTWVPVENEDLKFTAYYAEFDKNTTGNLIVKNPSREHLTIANTTGALSRIGEVVHGQTRIVGTFSIAAGNTSAINTHIANNSAYAQGITSGATGKLVKLTPTALIIRDVSTTATFRGGEKIRIRVANTVTRNATTGEIKGTGTATSATFPAGRVTYYDPINYANTRLILANTSYINSGAAFANARLFTTNTYIKGQTNGYSARIVTINNVTIDNLNLITNMIVPSNNEVRAFAKMATSTSARDASFFRVNINGDLELKSPRYVLSRSIEANTSASSATMVNDRSVEIKYELDGRNIVASPAIDLDRISLYHTHNLISTDGEISNTENYVVAGGNSESRYITRIVTLADGQDAEDLRVYLTAYKPSGSNIYVYYKVLAAEDNNTMNDVRWVPMELNEGQGFSLATRYSSSENKNDFIELVYDVPAFPTNLSGTVYEPVGIPLSGVVSAAGGSNTVTGSSTAFSSQLVAGNVIRIDTLSGTFRVHSIANNTSMTLTSQPASVSNKSASRVNPVNQSGANNTTGIIEYRNTTRARYVGYKYFQVKIVLVNSSSSNPPRVKDLRAIALQM